MDGIPERRPPKDQATAWATPRRAGSIHWRLKLGAPTRVPLLRVQDRGDPVAQVAGLGQLLHTQEHRTPIEQHLPTFSSSLDMKRTKWVVQSPRLSTQRIFLGSRCEGRVLPYSMADSRCNSSGTWSKRVQRRCQMPAPCCLAKLSDKHG